MGEKFGTIPSETFAKDLLAESAKAVGRELEPYAARTDAPKSGYCFSKFVKLLWLKNSLVSFPALPNGNEELLVENFKRVPGKSPRKLVTALLRDLRYASCFKKL